mgnify:FL=1
MEEDNRLGMQNEYKDLIKSLLIVLILILYIKTFIFSTTYIMGNSMYPTLNEGDILFINKIGTKLCSANKGDIVVIDAPDAKKNYIKRVIATAGDTVMIKDGKVYLNGEILEEDYIEEGIFTETYNEHKWEVPNGYVFVLGDNRRPMASNDSRFFGLVPVEAVRGTATFRYYPFNRIGKI